MDEANSLKAPDPRGPAGKGELTPLKPGGEASIWDDLRLQKLWLAMEKKQWRSLAVIAASKSMETLRIAELIAELAWRYRGQPSSVSDLRDLRIRLLEYEVQELQNQVERGTRLVVALRSIFENPTAAQVAKEVDAVLVCIALGETDFKAAEETIDAVGRERVIGSIVLRPRMSSVPPPTNGR
jgi:hypothetical protein